MFYKKILVLYWMLVTLGLGAQNLVPNPSFEDLIDCPDNSSGAYLVEHWFNPTNATSDIFNRCHPMGFDGDYICPLDTGYTTLNPWQWAVPINFIGCQEPHSGDGYAGIVLFDYYPWREYFQVKLNQSLIDGIEYFVQVHVSQADRTHQTTDAIHISFVSDSLVYDGDYVLDLSIDLSNPIGNIFSDTDNWITINWQYAAQGGEEYLVIGNLLNDESISMDSINPSKDHFWGSYVYLDDIYVGINPPVFNDEIAESVELVVWPNPVNNNIVQVKLPLMNEYFEYNILDLSGRTVQNGLIDGNEILLNSPDYGVYFLRITSLEDKRMFSTKLVIE